MVNTLNTDDFSRDVGLRLRAIREAHGYSQRELAKRAGVTNGFISQLEAAKINTSLSALKRVLDGIPIGLSEFFAYEPERQEQVFFGADELTEIGKGKISYRQVGNSLFGRDLQMLYEVYEPGADTGRVMLSHEGEEAGIVIEGRLEITVGEQRKILGPGDAYLFKSTTPHRFKALRNERCVVVSACTPPTF
ncbi:cupin domain-containing protein [Roseibium sp. FZY0029]|uniref:cupin domain-containing protein n=1 Tax=Roseibium sp. FZY0029 TaxID=3116647 RepID=UPI002E9E980B|nr:cupin domain-containing protein [Roseibium sp. FZY0029]